MLFDRNHRNIAGPELASKTSSDFEPQKDPRLDPVYEEAEVTILIRNYINEYIILNF